MDSSIDLNRKVKLLIKNKLIGSMKPYLAELSVGLAVAVGAMSIFYFHIGKFVNGVIQLELLIRVPRSQYSPRNVSAL